jgi:hypothetical protein
VKPCPGPGGEWYDGGVHEHKPGTYFGCREYERRRRAESTPTNGAADASGSDAPKYDNAVLAEREAQYGDPGINLGCAAELIDAYLNHRPTVGAADVAIIMCLLKIARIATGPVHMPDHLEDLCGYAELAKRLAAK